MLRWFGKILRAEDGVEIIEFLGLLPLLIGIGLVLVQVLLAGQTIMVAVSAAREGARAAAVCEPDVYGVVARASPGFSARNVQVENAGQNVKVTVGLRMPLIPNPIFKADSVPPIQASAVMRRELTRCSY
jgi:hypothetical protein